MLNCEPTTTASCPPGRIPFCGQLGIARYDGKNLPDPTDFRDVQGFDLSHTGISFSTLAWPPSDRLLISLGDVNSPILVEARVVACGRSSPEQPESPFEVRCEFARWLS